MKSEEVFELFIAAINRHDVAALASLMTQDHIFIDSLGNRVSGAAPMEAGWRGYFAMCPNYRIRTDQHISRDSIVLAAGEAGRTINGAEWKTPAAWKAVIREDMVAKWQVFADNKPAYEILAKREILAKQ
jgi:ketosteroid isomerase-like protein